MSKPTNEYDMEDRKEWGARDEDVSVEVEVSPESEIDKERESKIDAPPPKQNEKNEKTFYERNKTVIWIVIVILVLALFAGVGYGIAKALAEKNLKEIFWSSDCPKPSTYQCPKGYDNNHPPIAIVALAGYDVSFSWDIYDYARSIDHFSECGSYTHDMESAFPVSRHPSLYSVATGLYSDAHGIISDYFTIGEDEEDIFDFGNIEDNLEDRFYLGEPFWVTAPLLGYASASFYWPGTPKDPYNKLASTYRYPYDKKVSNMDRVDKALDIIEEEKPGVTFLYLEDPDDTVAKFGPDSDEAREAAEEVDAAFGTFMGGLIKRDLHQCVNVMLVVVRGFANVTCDVDNIYFIDQESNIDLEKYEFTPDELVAQKRLVPKEDAKYQTPEEIVQALKCDFANVTTYTKSSIPVRFHLTYNEFKNERIPKTITLAEPGTVIAEKEDGYDFGEDALCEGGADGYDVMTLDRKSFFVGYGPSFKKNHQMHPFRSVELYNLMAELMNLNHEQLAENNGTHRGLSYTLNEPENIEFDTLNTNDPDLCEYNIDDDDSIGLDCVCDPQDIDVDFEFYQSDISDYNINLDLSAIKIDEAQDLHAPFGLPEILNFANDVQRKYCVLNQNDYINAYSSERFSSIYTSFTMERPNANFKFVDIEATGCLVRQDPRLSEVDEQRCSLYTERTDNITRGYLTYPGLAKTDEEFMDYTLLTNVVPAYLGYVKGMYIELILQILRWADEFTEINIITGPIYDYDNDGKADTDGVLTTDPRAFIQSNTAGDQTQVPVPTHFFFVLTKCRKESDGIPIAITECDDEDIDPLSIILPNLDDIGTCMGPKEYFGLHVANLKDVELLTQLNFFPDLLERATADETLKANVLRQRVEVKEIW